MFQFCIINTKLEHFIISGYLVGFDNLSSFNLIVLTEKYEPII